MSLGEALELAMERETAVCARMWAASSPASVFDYFSRVFSKSERWYCVTRRELLAVVAATRHFKYYLCGMAFTIRTDHAALRWLMSFWVLEGQGARWLEEMQSYNFTVVHRSGTQHANATTATGGMPEKWSCRESRTRGHQPVAHFMQ